MNADLSKTPEPLKNMKPENIIELDVRPILKAGGEPFGEIMAAIKKTPATGALRLRATFEPKPLFRALGSQGWQHWVEFGANEDWMIWFYHEVAQPKQPLPPELKPVVAQYPGLSERLQIAKECWTLDVRNLAPPEPMEMTLAVLDQIPKEVRLIQINQRVPQFLLPLLEERGMQQKVVKNEEHDVRIEIKRH